MEKFKIAGLELHVNEVEYDGVRSLELVVYDGDERIARIEEDEDDKYVVAVCPGNPLLELKSFDYPNDAVIALAKHLHSHRPKVDSVSGRVTVLGDAHVTGDTEVREVQKIPEFSDDDLLVKRILERVASIAPSNEFEVELYVPKPGFRAEFPASVCLTVRTLSDWTVRTNLGRPPDSVESLSRYVDLCERTYRLAEDVRRSVEESLPK